MIPRRVEVISSIRNEARVEKKTCRRPKNSLQKWDMKTKDGPIKTPESAVQELHFFLVPVMMPLPGESGEPIGSHIFQCLGTALTNLTHNQPFRLICTQVLARREVKIYALCPDINLLENTLHPSRASPTHIQQPATQRTEWGSAQQENTKRQLTNGSVKVRVGKSAWSPPFHCWAAASCPSATQISRAKGKSN